MMSSSPWQQPSTATLRVGLEVEVDEEEEAMMMTRQATELALVCVLFLIIL
jgi:hypothetical protein